LVRAAVEDRAREALDGDEAEPLGAGSAESLKTSVSQRSGMVRIRAADAGDVPHPVDVDVARGAEVDDGPASHSDRPVTECPRTRTAISRPRSPVNPSEAIKSTASEQRRDEPRPVFMALKCTHVPVYSGSPDSCSPSRRQERSSFDRPDVGFLTRIAPSPAFTS
jgi:hypothetical protein